MPRNFSTLRTRLGATGAAAGEVAPPAAGEPPRYLWLADLIQSVIEREKYADRQALPSERELAEKYDVSRDTVRKTVRLLEERGVLYSEHGRGTFVAPALIRRMARFTDGLTENASALGGVSAHRILQVEPALASMAMAGLMGVRAGQPLTRVRWLRLIDDQPVGVYDAFVVAINGVTVDRAALEKKGGDLYALLRTQFGVMFTEAIETLSATQADGEDAELLKVAKGSPLLMCERVTLSERREPIEYCLMKYVQSYRYTTRVSKHNMTG